ncbi:MAG: methyltransferase domain-containing protein, partial [Pseudomonadota bacterium]|nr:methyltransferase domain-containing protein [Pseudomonadota bacterium]
MGFIRPKILNSCPICKASDISVIKSLPKYPITELFYEKSQTPEFPITEVDQDFCICNKCSHGFLKTVVSPEYLYADTNYNTVTTESGGAILSVKNFTSFILKNGYESNYTIDIGGNSSSLLEDIIAPSGCVIDPNAKLANGSKYEVLNNFFEKVETKDFDKKGLTIVSSHTLEHIESPNKFFEFLRSFSSLEKVYLQFPSLELMVESNRYDLINNQHLHYFTLNSIKNLVKKYDFDLINYEFDIEHYGTLRVLLTPKKTNINMIEIPDYVSENNAISNDFIALRLKHFTESACYLNEIIA